MAALAGGAALAAEAPAAVDPEIGVRPSHNVSVFHEIDFVAAFGHQVGRPLTVEVFRGGHRIGRATGPALSTPEGGGLEVNHGPVGLPLPGDCWLQRTPDIRPFDRIVVTDADGGQDAVLVDDIAYDAGQPVEDANGDITLSGHARTALGAPISAATLEGEFRLTSRLRGGPATIEETDAATGGFRAVYTDPYFMERNREGSTPEQIRLALLDPAAEHTIGFGHLDPFATGETQIADLGGVPGPAPGCGVAPAAGSNAATATDNDVVGPDSGDLVVGGTALAGVTEVALEVSDGVTTITRTTADLAAAPGAPAAADRAWSLTVDRGALDAFAPETTLTLTPSFTGAAPATAGALQVRKDVAPPAPPTADVPPGRHVEAPSVRLSGEPGARIFFTVDGTTPTTASLDYVGPIEVASDTTLRAIAVDAAGNVSPVAELAFTIRAPGSGSGTPPGSGAPPAAPRVVVLGVVDARSAVPVIGSIAPADSAVTLRVRGLRAPGRVTTTRARRRGVVASFVTPSGAGYARVRLYRLGGGQRRLLATRVLAATPGQRQTARFTSAGIRRRLTAGRYAVEVRTGPSLASLGPAAIAPVRVAR
jgi:hypothetical protein